MNKQISKRKHSDREKEPLCGLIKSELVDPSVASAWAKLLPTAPERLLTLTERQYRHKHRMEMLGMIFAMAISILCFIAAMVSIWLGYVVAAGLFFGITLLGLVSRFINLPKTPRNEFA